jgi:hypothetical protein
MISRIAPSEPFPEDLGVLEDSQVEVLNSKLHREIDHEYAHEGQPSPETETRLEEVTEELDFRDFASQDTRDRASEPDQADAAAHEPDEAAVRN